MKRIEDIEKGKQFYEVPEGYFEELSQNIQFRTSENTGFIYNIIKIPPILKIASATFLLFIIAYFIPFNNATDNDEIPFSEFTNSEVVFYFEMNNNSLEPSELLEIKAQVSNSDLLDEFTFKEEFLVRQKIMEQNQRLEEDYFDLFPL